MRPLLISVAALVFASNTYAAPAPQFRELDSNMVLPKAATPAPVVPATPTVLAPGALPKARDGEIIDSVGEGAIPALPLEAVKENGITYISGGIGDEEVAQLKATEEQYNLRIQISGKSGEYLSDISLTLLVFGQGKTLITMGDAGPYVYFQVPAGKYQIDLNAPSGAKSSTAIDVPANKAVKKSLKL